MNFVTVIGLVAGGLTTFAMLPQLIKILKTKSTKDISLLLFIMAFLGVILWLVYGFLINDVPVMVGNGISLLLVGSVLILKLKYDGN
ncbi:MAG: hypothetical protein A3F94_00815 [Candidatus Spechtbacteria bacterium RIFCSPLOWO2_12_FULL_38_22]|uniref:MtN3 and saliva related transmembrane protein n=1 Tax=Candidatus Spechtbacteria bacterium RIFCSPLOWO2_12_FULL_38_22 TaxID=1802165 RepID=A0A1G2HHP1_9BACT|nr:MAG: hypothetical protein A3E58_03015 [Candidatus Spechtbacteria bacterium RIFCSPHIGHO2_12_FULL_38_30]OGZ60536.1 MAG: hypothetical protein A3A00_00610 [Candidatus Spechtbacteria bacterium RIFCSPLOWO2_01_FULL_38_20]OGZ62012.1 MAG: hypothetical protein A3F94_00815 [Candidatus Spechtbacteria bacterium RIFCSPLOWO2_12_FULL_38_22]